MSEPLPIRSEILDTHNPLIKSARIVINAPAETIFDLLADPRRHQELDGTRTITGIINGPERLSLGARFGMKMHLGIRYKIMNTVVEYEENRLIAWPNP